MQLREAAIACRNFIVGTNPGLSADISGSMQLTGCAQ